VRDVPALSRALLKHLEHGRMVLGKGIQRHPAHEKAVLFQLALA
jgi:hypothetical protein